MTPDRSALSGTRRTVPTWIKLLVGLHVFATLVWALPYPPSAEKDGRVRPRGLDWILFLNYKDLKPLAPVRAYILATGAWQYWDMFAPSPARTDWYCTADVTFKDGSKRTVDYPRMATLPVPLKYVKERYRKFFERARDSNAGLQNADPTSARMWPVFAQAMALRAFTDPNNPPLVVRLKQHSLKVAPPGYPQPKEYETVEFFAYAVDGRWLRREAAER